MNLYHCHQVDFLANGYLLAIKTFKRISNYILGLMG